MIKIILRKVLKRDQLSIHPATRSSILSIHNLGGLVPSKMDGIISYFFMHGISYLKASHRLLGSKIMPGKYRAVIFSR